MARWLLIHARIKVKPCQEKGFEITFHPKWYKLHTCNALISFYQIVLMTYWYWRYGIDMYEFEISSPEPDARMLPPPWGCYKCNGSYRLHCSKGHSLWRNGLSLATESTKWTAFQYMGLLFQYILNRCVSLISWQKMKVVCIDLYFHVFGDSACLFLPFETVPTFLDTAVITQFRRAI